MTIISHRTWEIVTWKPKNLNFDLKNQNIDCKNQNADYYLTILTPVNWNLRPGNPKILILTLKTKILTILPPVNRKMKTWNPKKKFNFDLKTKILIVKTKILTVI